MKLVWPTEGDPWLEGEARLVPHIIMLRPTVAGLAVEYHWIVTGQRHIATEVLHGHPARHPHKAAFSDATRHEQHSCTEPAQFPSRPRAYQYEPSGLAAAVVAVRSVHRQLRQLIGELPNDAV